MKSGMLRHLVTIQQNTPGAVDAYGKPADDWQPLFRAWASVEPLSGRELFQAQQVQPLVTHRVRMRYVQTIQPEMRVLHGSRVLNVVAAMNIEERNREYELLCIEAA